ncbi:glycosyltransferase family 2 protein [Candidatus Sumerlaeota bacterium]|nr:glycosyltransferase family 2 protein [Candidatus Sumerlaeota bacterium]
MSARPRFTILICVKDRTSHLRACLTSLRSVATEAACELLIVCDGGPPSVHDDVADLLQVGHWSTRWIDVPAGGPAKARNAALPQASGELVLFLNDDVRCEAGLLRAHDNAHRAQPGHAVMGNTRWAPEACASEFMHWVAHHDSFYYLIADPSNAGWEYFHTMNLSVDRRWFEEGHRFDENFPDPAFEDTELGYRLCTRHGLRIAMAYEAVLYHVHEYTLEQYIDKSRERGRSARRFCGLYPELTERIISEYQQRVNADESLRGKLRRVIRHHDELDQWELRIAKAFLEGYEQGVADQKG